MFCRSVGSSKWWGPEMSSATTLQYNGPSTNAAIWRFPLLVHLFEGKRWLLCLDLDACTTNVSYAFSVRTIKEHSSTMGSMVSRHVHSENFVLGWLHDTKCFRYQKRLAQLFENSWWNFPVLYLELWNAQTDFCNLLPLWRVPYKSQLQHGLEAVARSLGVFPFVLGASKFSLVKSWKPTVITCT